MSLKRNILANYASQLYVTATGILILPLYIKYMGAEAYGLVGFFTMLQAWFTLLDLGLTPTIGRETARYHGGAMSALAFRQLLRSLTVIFTMIAVIGGTTLWLLSEIVAARWLNVTSLPTNEVTLAVQIMAISVALRWLGGLYRGVISGAERLVWLSGFNALIATLRFVAVFFSMYLYGFTPFVFFIHQLAVAALELLGLYLKSQRLIPSMRNTTEKIGWSFRPIQPLLKFAMTIAFTSSVWVIATQTDKLILSGILPLAEYGYFTLAVLVASGITVVSGPISNAIMPRMARLHAEGHEKEFIDVYRRATRLVSIIAGAAAITIAFGAEQLIFTWTGDADLASKAAQILQLYAIGNGLLAVSAFPYYLQYAKGNLRYHLIGNIVMVIVLIPTIILVATHYGGIGAGYVWSITNGLFLLTWVAFVHSQLEPGLHKKWMLKDILMISLPAVLAAVFFSMLGINHETRLSSLLYVTLLGGSVFLASLLGAGVNHRTLMKALQKFKG
ncbi:MULTISPECIES: oligosaccharide flippase family protein [unclassified Pseudomonas]|uniref:oligosaccharide flippase family protein n=1 Tax=unclassified Pseudomonas TaxID=196821 RepID=UPI000838EF89|nr:MULTISPECIES: oligosaccharide flippase family protein [unclassified Pseudomonas]QIH09986.1 oligosaccharide flippase family protein [Pseudomonas sp. BIOMIG1BAC]